MLEYQRKQRYKKTQAFKVLNLILYEH